MITSPALPIRTVFAITPLTVSGGATPSSTSIKYHTSVLHSIVLFFENIGTSTDLTFEVMAADSDSVSALTGLIRSVNLSATVKKAVVYIDDIPPYMYITCTNNDAIRTTTINCSMHMRR